MDDGLHWLATETGSMLHLFDENAIRGYFDDPFMDAGYRAHALCRSGTKAVVVAGYVPTADPTVSLTRPRTRLDLLDVAAKEWVPIVSAFDALDALDAPERAALLEWHAWWFATYDHPILGTEHLAARLDVDPLAGHPLAVPLALAGASGITGCCRRCRSAAEGRA